MEDKRGGDPSPYTTTVVPRKFTGTQECETGTWGPRRDKRKTDCHYPGGWHCSKVSWEEVPPKQWTVARPCFAEINSCKPFIYDSIRLRQQRPKGFQELKTIRVVRWEKIRTTEVFGGKYSYRLRIEHVDRKASTRTLSRSYYGPSDTTTDVFWSLRNYNLFTVRDGTCWHP